MTLRRLALLFLLACGPPLLAQVPIKPQTIGTANQCATIDATGLVTVGMQVTGTWSATLQPQVSISGQAATNTQVTPSTSTTPQSTITSNGVYYANVSGVTFFQVCASSYSSGTATVYFLGSDHINASLVGGGGTTYTGTNPIVVSGSAISCPTCGTGSGNVTTTPAAGQFIANITPTTAASGFGAGSAACSAFDTNGTTDMACAAATNLYTFLATGGTSFYHGWNYYFQTDMTQALPYGIGLANILEIPASGQVATDVSGMEIATTVSGGNASANGTTARGIKTRSFVAGSGTVLNGQIHGSTWYLPSVGAGATNNGQMVGYFCDNPVFSGTQNGIALCGTGGGSGLNVVYLAQSHQASTGASFAVANPDPQALCDGSLGGAGNAGSPSTWTNAGCIGMSGTTVTLPATITPANNSSLDAATTAFVQTAILDSIGSGTQCNVVWGTLYWYCDVYQYNSAGDMAQATAAALSQAISLGAGWVTLDARGYSNLSPVTASVNAFAALVGTGYQPQISGTWLLPCAYVKASAIQTLASFSALGCEAHFYGGQNSTQGTDWVLQSAIPVPTSFPSGTAVTSATSGAIPLSLTQATVSGGSVIYTGTITGGGSNAYLNDYFTITGFTHAGNNGTFIATASTTTTLTLTNAGGVNETHTGPCCFANSSYTFAASPTSSQVGNVIPYEIYGQCTTSTLGETGGTCTASTATTQARGLVTSVTASTIQVQSPVAIIGTNLNSTYAVTYPCAFVVGDLSGTSSSSGFAGFGTELAYMQIDVAATPVAGAVPVCVYNASNLTKVHDLNLIVDGNVGIDISSNQAQNMMGPWNLWITDNGTAGHHSPSSACAISSMTAIIGPWHDISCALGSSLNDLFFILDAAGYYGPEFHIIAAPTDAGSSYGVDLGDGNNVTAPVYRYSTPGNVSGSVVVGINAAPNTTMKDLVRIGSGATVRDVQVLSLFDKSTPSGTLITNLLEDTTQSILVPYNDNAEFTLGWYQLDSNGKSHTSAACAGCNTYILPTAQGGTGTSTPFVTNAQTATYQMVAADFSSFKTIPVASGTFTITVVASGAQPPDGQFAWVLNYGTGVVTIARSGQNLNGGTTSILIPPGTATSPSGALIRSDGTNYEVNVFPGLSMAGVDNSAGSTTIYVVNGTGITSLTAAGAVGCWQALNANTTATPTINFNGLGAKTITKISGGPVTAGDIGTSSPTCFQYNGSTMNLLNPQAKTGTGSWVLSNAPSFTGGITVGGGFNSFNGFTPVGFTAEIPLAQVSATSQTGAIATATLCAAAQCGNGSAGQYHVHFNFWGSGTACSSVTAGSVTFLLTWTDENATTHSAVAEQMIAQTGVATTAMQASFPFQTALANESASGDVTISTNGTIMQYATGYTACSTGTGTYNIRAEVTRIQ